MNPTPPWDSRAVLEVIDRLKHKPGALLPILHGIQDNLGHIPPAAVALVAQALQQTPAEIHGVISFYHHFRSKPPGRQVMQICRAEACQAVGSRELEEHAKTQLGIDYHATTPDREITLEPVYCLGNCACGPSVRVDNRVIGRVTPEKLDALLEALTTRTVEVVS